MKDVNIIVGRFQPFTLGHLKLIKATNIPSVLLVIETIRVDDRHPFISQNLKPCFDALKRHHIILDYIFIRNANPIEFCDKLYDKGYNMISWTFGEDREKDYTRMMNNYKSRSKMDPNAKCNVVSRSSRDISATSARKFLTSDDRKNFEKLVVPEFDFNYLKKIYMKS